MRKSKCLVQTVALAAAVLAGGSINAKDSIQLQLTDATSRAMTGFTSTGVATIAANELIGSYRFSESGLGVGGTLWSTCLSPNGVLDYGSHTYIQESFAAGSPGNNPSSWAVVA